MHRLFLSLIILFTARVAFTETDSAHALDGMAFQLETISSGCPTPDGLVFADGHFTSGIIEAQMMPKSDDSVRITTVYYYRLEEGVGHFTASLRLLPKELPAGVPEEVCNYITYEGTISGDSIEGTVSYTQATIPIFEPSKFTGVKISGGRAIEECEYWSFEMGHHQNCPDLFFTSPRLELVFKDEDYQIILHSNNLGWQSIAGALLKISGSCPMSCAVKDDALAYADGILTFRIKSRSARLIEHGRRVLVGDQSFDLNSDRTRIIIGTDGTAWLEARP